MTTRYVNTASTAGGNGTTNATSGANRAYATLAEWESAEQSTLSEDHEVLCCGTTADSSCTIDGWVPGSYRIIVSGNTGDAAGHHSGVWSTSFYRVQSSGYALTLSDDNITVQGIQVYTSGTGWAAYNQGVSINQYLLNRCIGKGAGTASSALFEFGNSSNNQGRILNCVAHDGLYGFYVNRASAGAGNSFIINCTASNNGTGLRGRGSGYVSAYNVLSFGNTADWHSVNDFDNTNSGYNAYGNSGTVCPGSTDIDLSSYAASDIYIDQTNRDLHLLSSGSAYSLLDNDGVGPSSNSEVPTDDIDRDTRSGTTTSVGADIIVASATSLLFNTLPMAIHLTR